MKASQKDFRSLAPRAAREARVFFFCGPDEAGANDAASQITAGSACAHHRRPSAKVI